MSQEERDVMSRCDLDIWPLDLGSLW